MTMAAAAAWVILFLSMTMAATAAKVILFIEYTIELKSCGILVPKEAIQKVTSE